MLTAALDGLVARFGLQGERVGEVAAGAVLKHSRDFNLTRECVLGAALAPTTPAYDVQQACGTGLETAILVANKIALGQIDVGIAGGVDTTQRRADRGQRGPAPAAARAQPARDVQGRAEGARAAAAAASSSRRSRATPSRAPGCRWASTRPSPPASGASPARRRTSSPRPATATSPPPTSAGFFDDLVTPYLGLDPRPEPAPRLRRGEAAPSSEPVLRRRDGGHDDRRQLDAAHRRRRDRAAGRARTGRRSATCRCSRTSSTPRPPRSTTCTATRAC